MKEKCNSCNKNIQLGQSITECAKCSNLVIHTRCFQKSNFKNINSNFYCPTCSLQIPNRYNPFKSIIENDPLNDDSDRFYEQNHDCYSQELLVASNILENCKKFDNKSINLTTTNFNTYFYNVDGNKSNFDTFASEIACFNNKFTVIGIVETNVNSDQKELYKLDGYNSFYSDKILDKSTGTGVAVYVHESFNATYNPEASIILPHIESLFVEIKQGSNEKINVGIIYRPPNTKIADFLNEAKNLLLKISKTRTYLLGDFNLNLFKSESISDISKFENLFMSEGFFPTISLATHHRSVSHEGTCIDNIFTNSIEDVDVSGVLGSNDTGHMPIFSQSNINLGKSAKAKQKQTQYYSYSKKNTDKLLEVLQQNYNKLIGIDPEGPNFSKFFDTFTKCIDEACKLDIPKTTIRNAINNPWITDSIINAIENKDFLYRDWKKTCTIKNPNGDKSLYDKFSNYRRCLKHIIKAIKTKFYDQKISDASGDPKKTWEIINQVRGKSKKSIKPQFIIDNKLVTTRRIIATEFNKYFVSLATKLNDSVKIDTLPNLKTFEDFMPHAKSGSIFLSQCSEFEVSKMISELQNGKSSDIPISVIKKSSSIISPILATHFNHLMEVGKFPDELKLGKITPVYKKDNEELLENYRPISTLPIFGKIFEKIIYDRLYNYFTSQGILYEKQFGFRKNHSTSHALNGSIDYIKTAIENKNHVLGIFIDLSKAFDTIDHSILLTKLSKYGIRGQALSLISSYLSNRTQCVSMLGELSGELPVIFGVPQGSCLGPLLFLIYINDLGTKFGSDNEIILFADDTNIFVQAKSLKQAYETANKLLNEIQNYMVCNKLHINMDKSCYMHFEKNSKTANIEISNESEMAIYISGTEIKQVKNTRFLGIIIDQDLTWEPHIKALSKKLASCTGSLNRITQFLPKKLHKELYHTLFESYITYGITVWGKSSKSKLKPLFKAQKKALRVVFGDREKYLDKFKTCARARPYPDQRLGPEFYIKEHTKPLFNTNKILALENLYFYHCCSEIFKVFKYREPILIFEKFKFSKSYKDLFLITPKPSNLYSYHTSVAWNSVRKILKIKDTSTSISILKEKLKKYLLEKQLLGDCINWIDLNFEDPLVNCF